MRVSHSYKKETELTYVKKWSVDQLRLGLILVVK